MRLVTVGTGTVSPSATRASAAHWIEADGRLGGWADERVDASLPLSADPPIRPSADPPIRLLLDCGAGTCHGLVRHGLPWQAITHIAITHYHADHIGELPALIFAMKYGAMEHRSAPLTIIGPAKIRAKLDALAAAFGDWVTEPGFPLEVVEIPHPPSPISLVMGITLDAHRTPHTEESVAYRVSTPTARMVYTGDTGPSDELGDWARGCDLLLAECSLPDSMAMDIHLTPRSAAALAARAEAKRLVLTHLYPPVEDVDIVGLVGETYAGPTVVARDGDRFDIGT
jgi:ribonuclease BN (tRNA processing enzyme)